MEGLILIAILPVIVLCVYIYKKDKDKEPGKLLRKTFFFGMLSIIPILLIELFLNEILPIMDNFNLIGSFVAVMIGVALVEELFKWLVVYRKDYNHKDFNHAYDAIVYAVFASLGFALIENLIYVLTNNLSVGILRAFTTIPSHACNAVIMGYYLGKAKQEEYRGHQDKSNKYMLLSLLMPILAHGVYDFLIFAQIPILYVLFVIFVLFLYIICFKLVKKVADINYNFDGTPVIYKTVDEIKVLPGFGPLKNVNSLESALYAVKKTLLLGVILIVAAIIAVATIY